MRCENLTDHCARRCMRLDHHHTDSGNPALPGRHDNAGDRVVRELQRDMKLAALARLAFKVDASAHRLDETSDDRETQAGAAVAAIEGAVGLRERIEDRRAFVFVDTDARVANFE